MATFPCCWEILCGTYSLFAECWLLCSFLVTKSTQEPETCTRITMWWSERILWCVCCLSPGWHGWPFSATETTVFYCWRLVKYAGFSLRILVAGERCNVTGENIILWMLEWKIFIGYRTSAGEFCVVNREFSDLRCLLNTLTHDFVFGPFTHLFFNFKRNVTYFVWFFNLPSCTRV